MVFDAAKDAANLSKHGVSLSFGRCLFDDSRHLIIPSIRIEDGEERFKVVADVEGRLFTALFVWRGGSPRFISVRRSNKGEERAYRTAD